MDIADLAERVKARVPELVGGPGVLEHELREAVVAVRREQLRDAVRSVLAGESVAIDADVAAVKALEVKP